MGNRSDNNAAWHGLVGVLATMPDVIRRLLEQHQPDPVTRRCLACTTPGSGTPGAEWPCPVRRLADEARQVAARDAEAGR